MPMSWNHETDAKVSRKTSLKPIPGQGYLTDFRRQLLLAILHTTNAKLDYPRLAEYMGPGTPPP